MANRAVPSTLVTALFSNFAHRATSKQRRYRHAPPFYPRDRYLYERGRARRRTLPASNLLTPLYTHGGTLAHSNSGLLRAVPRRKAYHQGISGTVYCQPQRSRMLRHLRYYAKPQQRPTRRRAYPRLWLCEPDHKKVELCGCGFPRAAQRIRRDLCNRR